MAFQSIPQSSFAGGLGRGIGQGLSEQIPKEVERIRLSQGLKGLKDLGNLPIEDQLSKLASIPGINAGNINQFIPFIQEMQARKALDQDVSGAGSNRMATSSQGQTPPQNALTQSQGTGYVQRLNDPNFLVAPEQADYNAEAKRQRLLNPALNVDQARALAKSTLDAKYQKDESLNKKMGLGDMSFDQMLEEKSIDISPRMKGFMRDKVREMILDGNLGVKDATKKVSDMLDRFSESKSTMKSLASEYKGAGRRLDIQKSIKEGRDAYEKVGGLEQFEKDLESTFAYSPELASQFAFPTENVADVSQIMNGVKSYKRPVGRKILPDVLGLKGALATVPSKVVDQIASHWDPELSIKALARDFELKGYDPQSFIDQISKFKSKFNDRQKDELLKPASRQSFLGDLWFDLVETRKKV